MTLDEYITIHRRLRKRYGNSADGGQYPYNNTATLTHTYNAHERLLDAIPATYTNNIVSDIMDSHTTGEITMLEIHAVLNRYTSHYANHGTSGRGLDRIRELEQDQDDIASLDTIRQIRQSIRRRTDIKAFLDHELDDTADSPCTTDLATLEEQPT